MLLMIKDFCCSFWTFHSEHRKYKNITKIFVSFRLRKRPESGSIRRSFRGSESESPGSPVSPGPSGGGGGVRTASLPVGGALVKESGDKRPVSAHSILNSVTRHSSLKTKVLFQLSFNTLKKHFILKWLFVYQLLALCYFEFLKKRTLFSSHVFTVNKESKNVENLDELK